MSIRGWTLSELIFTVLSSATLFSTINFRFEKLKVICVKGCPRHRTYTENKQDTQSDPNTLNVLQEQIIQKGTAIYTIEALRKKTTCSSKNWSVWRMTTQRDSTPTQTPCCPMGEASERSHRLTPVQGPTALPYFHLETIQTLKCIQKGLIWLFYHTARCAKVPIGVGICLRHGISPKKILWEKLQSGTTWPRVSAL